ncbi:MAG: hypothetical protein ABI895_42325 [Deltaproteobacteria bacterium]
MINIGSMQGVQSADPIKHIYQRGPGASQERVFLRFAAFDLRAGVLIELEFAYLDEEGPLDVAKTCFLSLKDRDTRRVATSGTVTVTRNENGPWTLSFEDLQVHAVTPEGTAASPTEWIGTGSIVGDVERYCSQGMDEADPSNPFCAGEP